MHQIPIDDKMRTEFLALTREGVAEICDKEGTVIGKFVRSPDVPALPLSVLLGDDWPSDEELERRSRESRSFTPEQVMDRLRSLDNAS